MEGGLPAVGSSPPSGWPRPASAGPRPSCARLHGRRRPTPAAASGRTRLRRRAGAGLAARGRPGDRRRARGARAAGGRSRAWPGTTCPGWPSARVGTLGLIAQVTLKLWPLPPASGLVRGRGAARLAPGGGGPHGPARGAPPGRVRPGPGPPRRAGSTATPTTVVPARRHVARRGAWALEAPASCRAGVPPTALPGPGPGGAERAEGGRPYEAALGVGTVPGRGGRAGTSRGRVPWPAASGGGTPWWWTAPPELRADPLGPGPSRAWPSCDRLKRRAFDPAGILDPGAGAGPDGLEPALPRAGRRATSRPAWPAACACPTAPRTGSRGWRPRSPRGRIAAMRAVGSEGRRRGMRRVVHAA